MGRGISLVRTSVAKNKLSDSVVHSIILKGDLLKFYHERGESGLDALAQKKVGRARPQIFQIVGREVNLF